MDLMNRLIKLLILEQGLTTLPPAWEHMNGVAPKEKFMSKIDMDNTKEILDALVLLINAEKFLQDLYAMKFEQILGIIKAPAFGETRTKIDVLAAQLASANQLKDAG